MATCELTWIWKTCSGVKRKAHCVKPLFGAPYAACYNQRRKRGLECSLVALEDDSFAGRIPACKGVIAFGATLRMCEDELRSTLEDWILVGLKLGHPLPVISGIDLN